jgi:hypothetical protein
VLLTPLLPWIAVLPLGRYVLPLVAPLTVYAAFASRVRARRYVAAWALGMAWAALLSAGVIALTELRPVVAGKVILHGPAYQQEMFHWIGTGSGKETTPAQFVPEHMVHLGAFVLLALVSGGYLGLVLGAFLMGYMSFFVGSYAARVGPVTGALAGWVPWSVVRVAAFVLLGAVLARPLLVRRREPESWLRFGRREWTLLGLAAAGIVVDLAMKILLAPAYGDFLRRLLVR